MPIIESVMGIQIIGNNGENIIKSPIVEAYIGSSLQDSTKVASDTPTDISTKVEQLMAAKHTHDNKAVLDKFAEGSDGKPTYNGAAIGSGSGGGGASTASEVSYTNESLEGAQNVKTALDTIVETQQQHEEDILALGDSIDGLDAQFVQIPSNITTGTNITLADNTEYRLTNVATLTLAYPVGNFECWLKLSFAASGSVTVTLPTGTKYIGNAPSFANGETWEMSIKDGVVIAQKVGDGT